MPAETCDLCRFYSPKIVEVRGETLNGRTPVLVSPKPPQCRRRAPVLGATHDEVIDGWPTTKPDDWCGEWEAANA